MNRASDPRAQEPRAEAPHDPFAELASLFLTERDRESGPAAEAGVRAAPIEIALVGHLPVMGGLWLSQYADQIARRGGPTALIRLERGQVTVELLRATGQRNGLESVESLDEALHVLAERAERWIVCPQSESALDGPLPGDGLSLLTGGDDAATVAAYRIVKSLAERWHAAQWPLPSIGLVVLGAASDRVAEVAEKLDRTTKAFLDVDLRVTGQFQRMDAIESAGRRTFPGEEPSVADLCRRIESAESRRRRRDSQRDPQRELPRAEPTATRPRPALKLGPKPAVRSLEPKPASPTPSEPSLQSSAEMALPGLRALAARCPRAPDVVLAVDDQGRLHLILAPDRLAVLPVVESWALEHWALLRLIESGLSEQTPDRLPIDVVTSDAPSVGHLSGTGVALHLIVRTPGGDVHVALT